MWPPRPTSTTQSGIAARRSPRRRQVRGCTGRTWRPPTSPWSWRRWGFRQPCTDTRSRRRTPAAPRAALLIDVCAGLGGACRLADVSVAVQPNGADVALRAHARLGTTDGGLEDVYFYAFLRPEEPHSATRPLVHSWGLWADGALLPSNASTGTGRSRSRTGSLGAWSSLALMARRASAAASAAVWPSQCMRPSVSSTSLWRAQPQHTGGGGARGEAAGEDQRHGAPVYPSFDAAAEAARQLWADARENVPAEDTVAATGEFGPSDPNAAYGLVTYGASTRRARASPTGGVAFAADPRSCTAPPASISASFHSMRLRELDAASGNYSLLLYFESPLCDDFVGLFLRGTVGDDQRACTNASYVKNFYFQVRQTSVRLDAAETEAQLGGAAGGGVGPHPAGPRRGPGFPACARGRGEWRRVPRPRRRGAPRLSSSRARPNEEPRPQESASESETLAPALSLW